jgi:hypothetical protein
MQAVDGCAGQETGQRSTDFSLVYENGTLSIVRYDDTEGDRDFNDLVLEVAIVGRRSWGDIIQAENQAAVDEKIKKEGLPRLRALLKKRGQMTPGASLPRKREAFDPNSRAPGDTIVRPIEKRTAWRPAIAEAPPRQLNARRRFHIGLPVRYRAAGKLARQR